MIRRDAEEISVVPVAGVSNPSTVPRKAATMHMPLAVAEGELLRLAVEGGELG